MQRNIFAYLAIVTFRKLRQLLGAARQGQVAYARVMETILALLTPFQLLLAFGVAVLAGTVKGLVGFAMPMIMISGLSAFISPEIALAGLILPTLVTNGVQALRQGIAAAWASVVRFRVFLLVGGMFLLLSAQLVRVIPAQGMLLTLGALVSLFALSQLMGRQLVLRGASRRAEVMIGGFAGLIGGFSGVWGPPTVAYLTALGTEKSEQMRVQGVIYGLGSVALVFAHVGSGVLRAETLPFSVVLVVPAVLGMVLGNRLQSRIDQVGFRRITLWVLLIAGLNLLRRGLF